MELARRNWGQGVQPTLCLAPSSYLQYSNYKNTFTLPSQNVLLMMLATERHEREMHAETVRNMGNKFGATSNEMEKITQMLHQVMG